MSNIQSIIEDAFENRSSITPKSVSKELKEAINEVITGLNNGSLRIASRKDSTQIWETHQWLKKAVLISFRIRDNSVINGNYTNYQFYWSARDIVDGYGAERVVKAIFSLH